MNQSLKSWSIHHGMDHYAEKKNEAKKNFRGQIWGQANFWGQAKIGVEAKIEAKIEARPTLGPGQANEARPGFIVCLYICWFCINVCLSHNVVYLTFWHVSLKRKCFIKLQRSFIVHFGMLTNNLRWFCKLLIFALSAAPNFIWSIFNRHY